MAFDISRSRKKKKRNSFYFMLVMFLVLIALFFFLYARPMIVDWLPTSDMKDLNEWFEVSGDEVRMYLDLEANMDEEAFILDGEVYLPFDFVQENINSRFYFNENEILLSYTLPDETVDIDENSLDEAGRKRIIYRDGKLYISTDLVTEYSNIFVSEYISEESPAKRVFLNHGGLKVEEADTLRNTALRVSGDKKSEILTHLEKGETILVTDNNAGWSRVFCDDGFIGYVDNDHITILSESYTYPDTYTEPTVTHKLLKEKVVLGFHQVNSFDANLSLSDLYAKTNESINVIAPTWLQISDARGHLTDFSSEDYVKTAHSLGLEVWAVLDNVSQLKGITEFDLASFFGDTLKRREFIDNLINLASLYGYDGFNIDLEEIEPEAGEAYTQFFRELSVECRKNNLVLSISNHVPYSYNSHYNLPEQNVFADYCLIMCYDEHTGSDVGPVASSSFTEFGITESLKSVASEQLLICLPLYTRVWRVAADGSVSSTAMGIEAASSYVSSNNISLNWDNDAGSYYGQRNESDGSTINIWMEDDDSLSLKTSYIKSYDVGGLGVWRLGYEPTSVWDILDLNQTEDETQALDDGTDNNEFDTGSE